MTESTKALPSKRFTPLKAIAFAGFVGLIVGAAIGCVNGFSGDDGSSSRALNWSILTGCLMLATMILIAFLGTVVLPRVNAHPSIGWAIIIGLFFAIMNGGGVLLGMSDKEFGAEIIGGILFGGMIGAFAGPFMQHIQRHTTSPQGQVSDVDVDEQ